MPKRIAFALAFASLAAGGCAGQMKNATSTEARAIATVANQLNPVDTGRLRACTPNDCEQIAKKVADDLELQASALNAAADRLKSAAK
jgi:hypothetical protein